MGAPRNLRAALALATGLAAAAAAQPMLDLNQRALDWTRGEFGSPLVCEQGDLARRGMRRLLVVPGPRHLRPPVNKLRFIELRVPEGSRCFTDTGEPQPGIVGALLFQLEAHSRPDIADRDFADGLRRDGGFTFVVREGILHVDGKPIDFADGSARFELVRRGSDAWRRLQDLPNTRKLHLTLDASDGTRLAFDLVQAGLR